MVVLESSAVVLELSTMVMASMVGSVAEASVLAPSIFVVFNGFLDALREGLGTMMVCQASSYSVVSMDPSVSPAMEEALLRLIRYFLRWKVCSGELFFEPRTVAPHLLLRRWVLR